MNKAAQAYFQTKVSTTDQGRLLLMLYDGALQFLQQAREKMLEKDYAAKGLLISRVIDIVNELSGSLNMEKGGTLAENLNNLYFLCTARLLQANLKMDVKQLDSVVGILSGLRSAYAEIIDKPEAKQAVAQIAQKMQPEASMVQRAAPITSPLSAPATVSQFQARQAYGGSRNARRRRERRHRALWPRPRICRLRPRPRRRPALRTSPRKRDCPCRSPGPQRPRRRPRRERPEPSGRRRRP